MPRKNFDKIIETAYVADQRSIADYLEKEAIKLDDELNDKNDEIYYGSKCEYVEGWLDCVQDEVFTFNKSIDHVLTEYGTLGDIQEIVVKSIIHSTQCERCNFALMKLLDNLDEKGNYKF